MLEKKSVKTDNFHTIYGSVKTNAKLLVAPDDMLSDTDKKENFKPIMYLNENKTMIYYASYGNNKDHGKDIYLMKKLPNNTWTTPINIGETINTSRDEDYPFLSEDGRTIYFSSTAHGSMGGYDVFKSSWDDKTNSWSTPVNLGAPINSPFDDLFYVEEK